MVFSTYYISSSFKECSRVIVEGMFIEYLRMVSNWHLFAVKNSLSHVGISWSRNLGSLTASAPFICISKIFNTPRATAVMIRDPLVPPVIRYNVLSLMCSTIKGAADGTPKSIGPATIRSSTIVA